MAAIALVLALLGVGGCGGGQESPSTEARIEQIGSLAGTLDVRPRRVEPGDEVFFRVVNTGPADMEYGAAFAVERLVGGTWESADRDFFPHEVVWPAIGLATEAGATSDAHFSRLRIPRETDRGDYRITRAVSTQLQPGGEKLTLDGEFEVR